MFNKIAVSCCIYAHNIAPKHTSARSLFLFPERAAFGYEFLRKIGLRYGIYRFSGPREFFWRFSLARYRKQSKNPPKPSKIPSKCPKYALRFGSYTPKIWRLSAQSFFGVFSAVERIFTEILVLRQRIGPQKPSKTVENCSFFA